MIKINGKPIKINRFPDNTLLIKEAPCYDNALISWFFETNEELVALVYVVNHLRSHGVKKIHLYMPYIPNARQDRVKTKEDVFTLKYFANTINSMKFDKVVVLDPHSSVSEALFENIEITTPKNIIEDIYSRIKKTEYNPEGKNTTLFYPDEGAMKRYSDMISAEFTFGIKNRDWKTGKINGLFVFGDEKHIKNCNILIVDDICSKGGTFYHSAKRLKELGAHKIFLFITHCENTIFEGELLTSGLIDKVFTTNSLLTKEHNKIEVTQL